MTRPSALDELAALSKAVAEVEADRDQLNQNYYYAVIGSAIKDAEIASLKAGKTQLESDFYAANLSNTIFTEDIARLTAELATVRASEINLRLVNAELQAEVDRCHTVNVPTSIVSDGTADVAGELTAFFETVQNGTEEYPTIVQFPVDGRYRVRDGTFLIQGKSHLVLRFHNSQIFRDRVLPVAKRYPTNTPQFKLLNCVDIVVDEVNGWGLNTADSEVYRNWLDTEGNPAVRRFETGLEPLAAGQTFWKNSFAGAGWYVLNNSGGGKWSRIDHAARQAYYATPADWGTYNVAFDFEHFLEASHCDRLVVKNSIIHGALGDGVYLHRCTNTSVLDCNIQRAGRQVVAIVGGSNLKILRNFMFGRRADVDIEPDTPLDATHHVEIAFNIMISGLLAVASAGKGPVTHVHIHDNEFWENGTPLVQIGSIDGSHLRDFWTVENNRDMQKATSQTGRRGPNGAFNCYNAHNTIIRNNHVPRGQGDGPVVLFSVKVSGTLGRNYVYGNTGAGYLGAAVQDKIGGSVWSETPPSP